MGTTLSTNSLPYFVTVGDLNGDGRMDLVVVDDGSDTYYLNTGNGGDGFANFDSFTFENSGGFGGNAIIRDLNNDGHQDVIITDVDVDISGCSRTTLIYRNLGNTPNVTMSEQFVGISDSQLQGVHDVAVFDINGDGWLDTWSWVDATQTRKFGYKTHLRVLSLHIQMGYCRFHFSKHATRWTFEIQATLVGKGQPASRSGQTATIAIRSELSWSKRRIPTYKFWLVKKSL